MQTAASEAGFQTLSEYIRHLHRTNMRARKSLPTWQVSGSVQQAFKSRSGAIYHGDSRDYLRLHGQPNSVDLIVTSPPFGLVTKKSYGNEDSHAYCEWFGTFASEFHRVLKNTGSLVIDIGGAWLPGKPARSLYHFEVLIMLCKEYGFHLCQEFYWWNPAKLPAPAEWVNVRRVRVKDAVNCVWWLAKTPYPKACNKRVLSPYSHKMKQILKNGYRDLAKARPSGHFMSKNFTNNNGGAVPPNLLAIANTESSGSYQSHCRENNIEIHPARFPAQLPEFFMRFLTDKGDIVLDPFAGSCVTGMVAESMQRKWVCVEKNSTYISGAKARFNGDVRKNASTKKTTYSISSPCAVEINESEIPLISCGGLSKARKN